MRKTARGGKARQPMVCGVEGPTYKPTLSLDGDDAKALYGLKPGTALELALSGTLQSVGIQTYGDKKATASVEIHKTTVTKKGKGGK